MSRQFRRTLAIPVLCVAVAAIGLLAVPAASAAVHPAQTGSAARFASEATTYQNKVIERALADVPGGKRISASSARWPSLKIGLAVPKSADAPADNLLACLGQVTYLEFCGFNQTNYNGSYVYAWNTTSDLWVPWGGLLPGQGMHSWYNQLETRVWREQYKNAGILLCIDPWPYGNYTDSNYSGAALYDYWTLLTTNPNRC